MKYDKIIFGFLFSVLLATSPALAQFDDLYYNPDSDGDRWANETTATASATTSSVDRSAKQYDSRKRDRQPARQERAGNTSYQDYNYYYYGSRIRRFHRPYRGFDFYSPAYTNRNFYGSGYGSGVSIYFGYNNNSPFGYNGYSNPYRNYWNPYNQPRYFGYRGPYAINNYYYGNPYGYGYSSGYYGGTSCPGGFFYDNNSSTVANNNGRDSYYGPRTIGSNPSPRDGRRDNLDDSGTPPGLDGRDDETTGLRNSERRNVDQGGIDRGEEPNRRRGEEPATRPNPTERTNTTPRTTPNRGGRTSPETNPSPNQKPSKNSGNNNSGRRNSNFDRYDRSDDNRAIQRANDRNQRRNRSIFNNNRNERSSNYRNNSSRRDLPTKRNRSFNRSNNRSNSSGINNSSNNSSINRSSNSSNSSGRKSSSGGRRN